MQANIESGVISREVHGRLKSAAIHHQTGASHNAVPICLDDAFVHFYRQPKVVGTDDESLFHCSAKIPLLFKEGWTRPLRRWLVIFVTTPSARSKVATRHFLGRAATPPWKGGECG